MEARTKAGADAAVVIAGAPQVLAGGVGEGFAEGLLDATVDGLAAGLGVMVVAVGLPPHAIVPTKARTARDANRLAIGGDYVLWPSSCCSSVFATLGLVWGALFLTSAISAPSACFFPAR